MNPLLFFLIFLSIISVRGQIITAPYFENFDNNFNPGTAPLNIGSSIDSAWSRDNYPWNGSSEYAWGGGTGATSTVNTGPSGDHTSGNGNYVYAEASAFLDNRARLISPPISLDTLSNPELSFWVHQYGSDIDFFSVQIFSATSFFFVNAFSQIGNQGNQWQKITIPLNQFIGDTVIFVFNAWRNLGGSSSRADIAIDDIRVRNAPICPMPFAQFADSTAPLSLTYSAMSSSGAGISYNWAFGDGTSASGVSGTHSYTAAGIYNVTLTITDSCGQQDIATKSITICDSTINPFSYVQNGTTTFFDATNSAPFGALQYSWDFGDGTTAIGFGSVISHTYATPGSYVVTLFVTNLCGDTISVSKLVQSCEKPTASWTFNIISSNSSGMTVEFSSQNSNGASDYLWDFGDGNTSTSSSPIHTYAIPGLFYRVTLVVLNTCNQTDTSSALLSSIETDEYSLKNSKIYPNPTTGVFWIDFASENQEIVEITISDAQGQILLETEVFIDKETIKLDLTNLPDGLYLVSLRDKDTFTCQKIKILK